MTSEPLITPAQASNIRVVADILRSLQDDGYIDFTIDGGDLAVIADQLDALLATYVGTVKAPALREVT